ncbi:hypothetical protein [Humibacter sp.]|jgi:hypothetical protein|uniref:hypothetical protein n=1 Tax=Humibacter sp. TaxID=1940291 RepID=UPI003F7EF55A
MKLKSTTAKMLSAAAIACTLGLGGVTAANAATVSPHVVGQPEELYFGADEGACLSTQALYKSEDAHIIQPCYDLNAGILETIFGRTPDWTFEYQWT